LAVHFWTGIATILGRRCAWFGRHVGGEAVGKPRIDGALNPLQWMCDVIGAPCLRWIYDASLMKAEMILPGREVAYIVKARERFGG
jgi:hypothetical protein